MFKKINTWGYKGLPGRAVKTWVIPNLERWDLFFAQTRHPKYTSILKIKYKLIKNKINYKIKLLGLISSGISISYSMSG